MSRPVVRTVRRSIVAEALESRRLYSSTAIGSLTSDGRLEKFSESMPDGAAYTVEIKFGTAVLSQVNSELNLSVTGTTPKSELIVTGEAEIGNVVVAGPLKEFSTAGMNLAGVLTIDGSISKLTLATLSGTLSTTGNLGVVQADNIRGTLAAAGSISKLTVSGTLSGATILSGANLGADGVLGGGNDTFIAGLIGALTIVGPVLDSTVAVGISPGTDGVFGTADDVRSGGGIIGRVTLDDGADGASHFEAGGFGVVRTVPFESFSAPTRLAEPLLDSHFLEPT